VGALSLLMSLSLQQLWLPTPPCTNNFFFAFCCFFFGVFL
jgi:hypothetical protein